MGWHNVGSRLGLALDFAAVASTFAACRSTSSRDAIAAGDILHAAVIIRDELPLNGWDELVRLSVGGDDAGTLVEALLVRRGEGRVVVLGRKHLHADVRIPGDDEL